MFPALIMRGRPKTTRLRRFQLDPFEEAVKRQVEIEPGLFAVRDDVQSGGDLVVNRRYHRVFLQFSPIRRAELIEMLTGEFQPAGKGITADNGCSERSFFQVV